MTQSEFAKKVNISVSYLSNIERGNKNASFKLLSRIKERFNLPSEWLLIATSQGEKEHSEENEIVKHTTSKKEPIISILVSIQNFSKGINQLYSILKDNYNKDIFDLMHETYHVDFRSTVSYIEKEKNRFDFMKAFDDSDFNEHSIKVNDSQYYEKLESLKIKFETVFFTLLDSFYDFLKKE